MNATEEIRKTSLGLGSHELKISEFGGKHVSISFQLKVLTWEREDIGPKSLKQMVWENWVYLLSVLP